MKKFIAIITLVSMLSCVSCSEKTESSSVASSSSSTAESSSVAERSDEESSAEESSSAVNTNEDEYKDWYGLHMYFPVENGDERSFKTSSTGYPVWYQYKGEKPAVDFTRGYSTIVGKAKDDGSDFSPVDAAEEFFGYEVGEVLNEAYSRAFVKERNTENTEEVKVLDKDFIRETGYLKVSNSDKGNFNVYYVCYVGTPGFTDSLFEKSPAMWIAFSDDESDKDFIAEMADRAANDLEYAK